ncbi:MAG: hypothetical protein R3C26_25505 [Calditrichia bacterium]
MKRQVLFDHDHPDGWSHPQAQESASGKTGETGSGNGLNRQTNTESRADISPDHRCINNGRQRKGRAYQRRWQRNINDQTELKQHNAPVAQWRYLSG